MEHKSYTFGRLTNDLKADLEFYAKTLLNLERVSYSERIKITLKYPTIWLLFFHRYELWINSQCNNKFIIFFLKIFSFFGKRIFGIITKSDISPNAKIGPGLCLAGKKGMMLGAKKIGNKCIVYENVTIGMDHNRNTPDVGDFVKIGPNSIIYGDIKIGTGVIVKESTVLTKSVPDYCIVKGNPGRIVERNYNRML